MIVMKKKNIDWKYYLRELALSDRRMSDIERTEFAGYLLKRDIEDDKLHKEPLAYPLESMAELISAMIINESPDTIYDLVQGLKSIVTERFKEEINYLLKDEEKLIEEERLIEYANENPNDEYDPNIDGFVTLTHGENYGTASA